MIILLKWLSYLKVMKREILLKSILGVGISGLYIVQALVMTRILDGLLAGSAFRQLAMLIALVLLVMVLRGIPASLGYP